MGSLSGRWKVDGGVIRAGWAWWCWCGPGGHVARTGLGCVSLG
jgi:hypothetical protein